MTSLALILFSIESDWTVATVVRVKFFAIVSFPGFHFLDKISDVKKICVRDLVCPQYNPLSIELFFKPYYW